MESLANVANLADVTRRLSGAFASYWEGEGVKRRKPTPASGRRKVS